MRFRKKSVNKAIPIVVAGIVENNKILLLKRNREPFKGLWSLPGGKIEFGEFAKEAVNREVEEETSIKISSAKYLGLVCEKTFDCKRLTGNHIIHVFLCSAEKNDFRSSEEGELRWFTLKEVDNYQGLIIPTDYMIAKVIIFGKNFGYYNSSVKQLKSKYELIVFSKEDTYE